MGYGGPDGPPQGAYLPPISELSPGYSPVGTSCKTQPCTFRRGMSFCMVVSIGVNLLWPVIRGEKGSIRYLAAMNWVINRPWVPLLWPWCQVAKAQKQCSY